MKIELEFPTHKDAVNLYHILVLYLATYKPCKIMRTIISAFDELGYGFEELHNIFLTELSKYQEEIYGKPKKEEKD